jgi:ribosomal-protein-alanine N-acetyltransferase
MQNLKLKPIGEEHLKDLIKLERELFEEPYSETTLKRDLEQPFFLGFAAVLKGEVVGYSTCWVIGETCEIHRIGVSKRFQGRGIGRRILEKTIEECRKRKVKEVFLEVAEDNGRALKLYRRLGFKTAGERKNYYGKKKALVLKLNLKEEKC